MPKLDRGLLVKGAAALVLVVLMAVTASEYLRYHRNQAETAARAEVSTVAVDSVTALLSYKATTVDGDVANSLGLLTGEFADDYRKLSAQTVVPAAKEKKIDTVATVAGAGVIDASDSRATVLVFVNQSTTSVDSPDSTLSPSRVRVTLEKVEGRWLIEGLEPV